MTFPDAYGSDEQIAAWLLSRGWDRQGGSWFKPDVNAKPAADGSRPVLAYSVILKWARDAEITLSAREA